MPNGLFTNEESPFTLISILESSGANDNRVHIYYDLVKNVIFWYQDQWNSIVATVPLPRLSMTIDPEIMRRIRQVIPNMSLESALSTMEPCPI